MQWCVLDWALWTHFLILKKSYNKSQSTPYKETRSPKRCINRYQSQRRDSLSIWKQLPSSIGIQEDNIRAITSAFPTHLCFLTNQCWCIQMVMLMCAQPKFHEKMNIQLRVAAAGGALLQVSGRRTLNVKKKKKFFLNQNILKIKIFYREESQLIWLPFKTLHKMWEHWPNIPVENAGEQLLISCLLTMSDYCHTFTTAPSPLHCLCTMDSAQLVNVPPTYTVVFLIPKKYIHLTSFTYMTYQSLGTHWKSRI